MLKYFLILLFKPFFGKKEVTKYLLNIFQYNSLNCFWQKKSYKVLVHFFFLRGNLGNFKNILVALFKIYTIGGDRNGKNIIRALIDLFGDENSNYFNNGNSNDYTKPILLKIHSMPMTIM